MNDTKFKETLKKTREYLDYLEEHYDNVQKAWKELQEKLKGKGFSFIYDDWKFFILDEMIKEHDISKLSAEEFIQYRKNFFPIESESMLKKPEAFDEAWKHHWETNSHHFENWTTKEYNNPFESALHCVHMVVDWIAMGYKFKNNARNYYKKEKQKINLPLWADKLVNEIFDEFYGKEDNI